MKNLLLTLIVTIIFGNSSFAQEKKETYKIACYVTSCCSFYFFTVEVISTKHCHYITVEKIGSENNKYSIKFEANEQLEEVGITQDVIMPQFMDQNGNAVVLAKGKYTLTDNELIYSTLPQAKVYKICHEERVTGNILGHEIDYTIKMCAYYIWFKKAGQGSIKMTPVLSPAQIEDIIKNDNQITFNQDVKIKNSDFAFTIKAGNYSLNEDGSIYLLNTKLEY